MNRYIPLILNTLLGILFIYPYGSQSIEIDKAGIRKNLLSADLTKSNLELSLLGTIVKEDTGTAIIKNLKTGKLKTYAEGERIDLIYTEEVVLAQISDCVVMIKREDLYETLSCEMGNLREQEQDVYASETAIYRAFFPLSKYKVVSRSKENKNGPEKAKHDYESEIIIASNRHGIDPYLVKAVIKAESNFNPLAVSPKKAMGMMQLIPETAKDYGVMNPFDPEENIDGGIRLLKDLINYFDGDLKLALAAYNAGKGSVIRHGFQIPPYSETIDYVDKVLGYYSLLKLNRY